MTALHRRVHRAGTRVIVGLATGPRRRERGDVPGWVLITLMTAALVAALWTVAEDQLVSMFQEALNSVRN